MKLPFPDVVNSRTCFVIPLVIWTVAPATTAPAESITVPVICPVTVWALAIGIIANKRTATANETYFMDGPLAKFKRFKNSVSEKYTPS